MSCNTAYVNGTFLPLEQARVPVLDRGLLFADAVYEVIPIYAGRPFLLTAHLQRLQRSLDGIRLHNPHTMDNWRHILGELITRNGGGDISVYLQITRGVQPQRTHTLPEGPEPTVIAFCQPRNGPAPELLTDGMAAITRTDERWRRCEIKSTALLPNVLAADDANNAEASEAILIRDGEITEGASSNVFAQHDGVLITPPLDPAILPGITRAEVLRLARADDIDVREQILTPQTLADADEIWLTSSTREIYPVTKLDHQPVGTGRPGPLWAHLRTLLQDETHVA